MALDQYRLSTYHNGQRARPRSEVAHIVNVHLVIRAERIEHEVRHLPGGSLCAAHIFETEDNFEHRRRSLIDKVESHALVLTRSALQLVAADRSSGVDLERVREVRRLVTMCQQSMTNTDQENGLTLRFALRKLLKTISPGCTDTDLPLPRGTVADPAAIRNNPVN